MSAGSQPPAAPDDEQHATSGSLTERSVGPLGVLASVFRAWFGVQNDANRERDFTHGNPRSFIIAGIVFVIVMVVVVMMAVNAAISASS